MTQFIPYTGLRSLLILPLLLLGAYASQAQYKISGTVLDDKNKPVRGANVYLDNTIDGGTTDSMGVFRFTTSEKGNQTIVATEVSHQLSGMPIVITGDVSGIVLHIKANAAHDLNAVVITAGSFDASNDKTKAVLKPLDIVTTAGANADVVKAFEMLPGTQKTGADNGLFVRGGDASEAAILVDEMVVQNAFFSGPPGVSTRSRFGAFNYEGVSFSSGGYSAKYGQALSSVLELNSTDLPDKSNVNLGLNMAGIYVSGTKKWKNSSLDVGGNYNNTAPFFALATTNFKFIDPPQGTGGNMRYTWKPNKTGILKVGVNATYNTSGILVPNPYAGSIDTLNPLSSQPDTIDFRTKDAYYYSNVSYKQMFKNKYSLYTAASYSLDQTRNKFGTFPINEDDHRAQFRIEGKDFFTSRLNLLVGTDIQSFGIDKKQDFKVSKPGFDTTIHFDQGFTETIASGYAELEWTPVYWFAVKPGVRYEHSVLLNLDEVAPRISMAVKTGTYSQASLAGGIFYQDPDNLYLLGGLKTQKMQSAVHYIANWQWSRHDRTLRIEGYFKNYCDLVREPGSDTAKYDPNSYRYVTSATRIDNSGYGYAQGVELFWRDKKSMKNLDYWVSYSYIDTRRKYINYPTMATPPFIANHNLNLVGKYFVDKWHTNFSATYSYASGRPYYNQYSTNGFLGDRTIDYQNFAITAAYLHTFGKWFTVFYISIDNITNQHNVFGYRYRYDATDNQIVGSQTPIVPALYRSIFFGVNMSLTQFSKDEL